MFKELVSLAIILGFVLNVRYVDHPDTRSYTLAFVGSLLALSPFALAWIYRAEVKKGARPGAIFSVRYWRPVESVSGRGENAGDVGLALGLVDEERERRRSRRSGDVSEGDEAELADARADVEKGRGPATDA